MVKMEDGEVAVRGVGRGEDMVLKAVEALGRRKEELARAREETVARLAGMEEGVVREGKQERRASWVVEWDGNPEDIHDDEERKEDEHQEAPVPCGRECITDRLWRCTGQVLQCDSEGGGLGGS